MPRGVDPKKLKEMQERHRKLREKRQVVYCVCVGCPEPAQAHSDYCSFHGIARSYDPHKAAEWQKLIGNDD